MRVHIVRYARQQILGNYENERVEYEALVEDGEVLAEVLDDLRVEADMWLNPPPVLTSELDPDEPPF